MSKSDDCASNLHDYCVPCDCECHSVNLTFLLCNNCGKRVSTGFYPVPTDTPDKGLIVRAWIECPECIEKKYASNVGKTV